MLAIIERRPLTAAESEARRAAFRRDPDDPKRKVDEASCLHQ